MKPIDQGLARLIALAFALMPSFALAFNSGSTGADGALTPTVSADVQLPPDGILNYTTVNIPAGVTVTFKKNAANKPVQILASGDVTIAGTIDVRGKTAPGVGTAGGGNQGDDGQPGVGGPGGFDGGKGATGIQTYAGAGLGPGGGHPGYFSPPSSCNVSPWTVGGTGGGFGTAAAAGAYPSCLQQQGGIAYGSSLLLPLIGGSGGAGGGGGPTFDTGGGGGGAGGAILIAASGTLNVTGSILADGGGGAAASGAGVGATGGGGSGGAIRLMATTISGNGPISAQGGPAGAYSSNGTQITYRDATAGAPGRIRLEGETITRTAATTPPATSDLPGSIFVAGLPTLTITSVAGVNAPANPTGNADITLPAGTANPVTVTFATTGVPVGNTVKLTVTPQSGQPTSVVSPAITGSTSAGTASVATDLPVGPSVLQAQTTYTIVAALGDLLRPYAGNERVEQIELTTTLRGPAIAHLITASGKRFEVPQALLAMPGM